MVFVCEFDGHSFTTKFNINRHVNEVHSSEKLNCDVCYRRFARIDNLIAHKNTHSDNLKTLQQFI